MEDIDTIENYINSLNASIEALRDNKDEIENVSDLKILAKLSGKSNKALDFLFDTKLDVALDKMFNKFMTGDYEDVDKIADTIGKTFELLGFGDKAFSGPVSQLMMQNITNSINTVKFEKTKSNVKKSFMIIKNLKRQATIINDKDTKKKYLDACYALKQIVRYLAKVYRERRLISDRVKAGLHNMINESLSED